MSDEAERIRRMMQDVRQEMGHDVHAVVERAKQLSDWRYYVRQHPWACLGSAFALGFLATPAPRKALAGGELQAAIDQLKKHGLSLAASTPATGGVVGRVIAIAGPLLLKNAASLIAQRMQSNSTTADQSPHLGAP